MPPEIEVNQVSAGGVTELMDELSDETKARVSSSLKKHLAKRYGYEIVFVDEANLKATKKKQWIRNRALYEAVAYSIFTHGMSNVAISNYPFPTKKENFDYTLGSEISALNEGINADLLLFINGYDYYQTAGQATISFINSLLLGAYTSFPKLMTMSLVSAKSGDVIWFKHFPLEGNLNLRNEKKVDDIIEWFTRDLLQEK